MTGPVPEWATGPCTCRHAEASLGEAIYEALYPGSTLVDGDLDRFEGDQDAVWAALRGDP